MSCFFSWSPESSQTVGDLSQSQGQTDDRLGAKKESVRKSGRHVIGLGYNF